MKYLSIDTETTFLDIRIAKVVQFGCVIEDTDKDIPLNELPSFEQIIVQPFEGDTVALQMNKAIFDKMPLQGVSPAAFIKKFEEFLISNNVIFHDGKYQLSCAGKNFAAYDMQILNQFPGFADKFRLRSRVLDPAILFVQKDDAELPSLQECLLRGGINKIVAHTAKLDALDVIALIRKSGVFSRKECNPVTL